MKKNLKWVYYRHPRTTAEARANQEGWERPQRRRPNLANAYDDRYPTHEKSWKSKRKTQYHPNGRGKHHQIRVEEESLKDFNWDRSRIKICQIENYLKDHNIPYRIERRMRFNWVERYRWVWKGKYETLLTWWDKEKFTRKVWEKEYTGEFYRAYYIDHYIVHWWYDKDIGLEYIFKD